LASRRRNVARRTNRRVNANPAPAAASAADAAGAEIAADHHM
jgi:hypothetical protein